MTNHYLSLFPISCWWDDLWLRQIPSPTGDSCQWLVDLDWWSLLTSVDLSDGQRQLVRHDHLGYSAAFLLPVSGAVWPWTVSATNEWKTSMQTNSIVVCKRARWLMNRLLLLDGRVYLPIRQARWEMANLQRRRFDNEKIIGEHAR